ncbi:VOC family protein [Streptomyces neyagawaensis]|uniref:VOC family protein n=1 Tax=Streptomyces neyagawaensis TaxID=42238 RepID=UPI000AC6658E|nr:VOC family protein [Streptomyces neyagawaensis]MCL6732422.1 VOC family protein [Streptomyces neyagawaensis]MDE1685904.1 VOC family protein [Streptomyces neyagawaensis]
MGKPFEAGVVVRDLELMERFYRDVLGCPVVRRSCVPKSVAVPAGLGGELLVVWLQVPSGGRVKLILPQVAADSVRSAPAPAGCRGLSYLTFHVEDIDPMVSSLVAAGARPLSEPIVVRTPGGRISFWADPEGNAVELVDERGRESCSGRSN